MGLGSGLGLGLGSGLGLGLGLGSGLGLGLGLGLWGWGWGHLNHLAKVEGGIEAPRVPAVRADVRAGVDDGVDRLWPRRGRGVRAACRRCYFRARRWAGLNPLLRSGAMRGGRGL